MKKLFEKLYKYRLFRILCGFASLLLVIFSSYKLIIGDGYKFIREPTDEFINEVKLRYINDFNLLKVEEIKFEVNYNSSCREIEVETDKLLLTYHTSDIIYAGEEKPRVRIYFKIKEPKVSFYINDLTEDLGVNPEINRYILDRKELLKNICTKTKHNKEEQKKEHIKKVEKQLSMLDG